MLGVATAFQGRTAGSYGGLFTVLERHTVESERTAGDAARYLKILGDTPWEQAKTFLAIVGIVSLVMQFMGRKDD